MGPGDLSKVLAPLSPTRDPRLLVGFETFDDAGVFRVADDLALVQTVDFFAPIVDDPFDFGRIAAANALSDVYAMGGEPLTALVIAAFPTDTLPLDVLSRILQGGQETVHKAGALIVGGHTVVDTEIKYGLAVTGRVHPDRILTNAAAREGDRLVLTKPLGTGLLATAGKRGAGALHVDHERQLIASMASLNADASRVAVALGVRCATDVTGFGLLGHASHIARASNVTLAIAVAKVPVLPGARAAWESNAVTGGAARNESFVESLVSYGITAAFERALLIDPQTSGGLLLAVPEARVAEYLAQVSGAVEIGSVRSVGAAGIVLT